MLPENTVLMSSRAPVGYAAIAGRGLSTNQGFKSFAPTPALWPEYFYYFILGNRRLLLERSSGSTFQEISGRAARTIPIPIAPIAEQRRIVAAIEEHLSRLDASRAGLRRACDLLRSMRTSVLDSAVQARLTEPAGAPFPAKPLGSLLAESPQNGRSVPTSENGFPVLRLTCVRNGRIDVSERKMGAWTPEEANRYLVRRGDFFVVRGNGSRSLVARAGLVVNEPDPVAFPDTLIRIRARKEVLLPAFLNAIWDAPFIRDQLERASRTSAGIYKVNQSDLKRVLVPVPSVAEQQVLAKEIDHRTSLAAAVTREVEAAMVRVTRLRHSILRDAFAGRLVPQHPSDEPAHMLLERIRNIRSSQGSQRSSRRA